MPVWEAVAAAGGAAALIAAAAAGAAGAAAARILCHAGATAAEAEEPARFRIDGDGLAPANLAARRWLAAEAGGVAPLPTAAFAARWPRDPSDPIRALELLERDGAPFDLLLQDTDGADWRLTGEPEAGEAVVLLGRADATQRELARARAEADAAQAEARALQRILDAAPVLVWRRDASGRLDWANAAYRAFTGAPEGEGAPRELRLPAEARARPAGALMSGRVALFDARDGNRRWHEAMETAGPDGGVTGYAVDAAPAVQAETALRRFVETLTETFAHLRVGLAIFDGSRRLGLFNPAFVELMRLDPGWLAGRPRIEEVLARMRDAGTLPEAADHAAWRQGLLELFDRPDAEDRDERWELPGETSLRVLARPHPQGALALLIEDVSQTTRLERRWSTEVETRRATMDRLQEGVAAFGPDGRVRFANLAFARIWGFRPGDERVADDLDTVLDAFRDRAAEGDEAPRPDFCDRLRGFVTAPGGRAAWSEPLRLADGRRLRARVAALPDGSALTAFEDVTDADRLSDALEERNQALETAEEMRAALLDQMIRLRMPINALGGLGERLADQDEAQEIGSAVIVHAQSIAEAVHGMADLASVQTGAIALTDGATNLAAALSAVAQRLGPAALAAGVELRIVEGAGGEAGAAAGDSARVRQIVFNLATDALHRCPEHGAVELAARRRAETVEIAAATADPHAHDAEGPPPRGLSHALARRLAGLLGGRLRTEAGTLSDGTPCLRTICVLPAAETVDGTILRRPAE